MEKKRKTHSKWNNFVKTTILEIYLSGNTNFATLTSIRTGLKKALNHKYMSDQKNFPRKPSLKKVAIDSKHEALTIPVPSETKISQYLKELCFTGKAPYRLADELATLKLLLLAIDNKDTEIEHYRKVCIKLSSLNISYNDIIKIFKDAVIKKSIYSWEIRDDFATILFYEKKDQSIANIFNLLLDLDLKKSTT